MKMTEIKKVAVNLGIKPGRMKKGDLIKAVQSKEGNFPCFQVKTDFCDQFDCCWRSDCQPGNA
ncbi:MAG: hypothetical protein KQH63_08840 [Desulfobulbaceae bacterium]|nr:hypothetical protein [Desulfobulbaceae bacterium]